MAMLKHQCRYCSLLVVGNGIWCGYKQTTMSEAATKRRNRCKYFEFCEIDAYGEHDWEPDKLIASSQPIDIAGQMTLEFCL